jgi:hypothetical protein
MDHLIGLSALALFVAAAVTWGATLKWGVPGGGTALLALGCLALFSSASGSSHAEAMMGRGLAVLFVALPAGIGGLIGLGLGWLHRRNN